ncbi:ribosome modulation factor [Pseudomonas zhanjiangensis]|uniref:Ribosome modulation factor n=1 Tax=Pseudomonas zhanjiangensis TaxID=3239015 RepID=A0ABV3YUV6_9PSED
MAPAARNEDDRHWSLESLNKAYKQGYMAGLTGQPITQHEHTASVLAAAWEAGWDDGHEQYALAKQRIA